MPPMLNTFKEPKLQFISIAITLAMELNTSINNVLIINVD